MHRIDRELIVAGDPNSIRTDVEDHTRITILGDHFDIGMERLAGRATPSPK